MRDKGILGFESVLQLLDHFTHQGAMLQLLPRLHNANNGSLDLQLAILLHHLVRVLTFLFLLLLNSHVHIHLRTSTAEVGIESEDCFSRNLTGGGHVQHASLQESLGG